MELFASFIPYFPPQKTPMGLPLNIPPSSAAPSNNQSSLGERYGVYASASFSKGGVASWGVGSHHHAHLQRSSSAILLGSSASPSKGQQGMDSQVECMIISFLAEAVCLNVLIPLVPCGPPSETADHYSDTEQLVMCLLESLTELTGRLHWDDPSRHLRGFAHLFFLFKLFYLACLYKDFRSEAALYSPPSPLVIGKKNPSPM